MLMVYEACRDLPLEDINIETPLAPMVGKQIKGKKIMVVPIFRAGLGMEKGILDLIPSARVGHIGLFRDERTLQPVEYYCKLPKDGKERIVIIPDPMLATGRSAVKAIDLVKKNGAQKIKFLCIVATKVGIDLVHEYHPDVDVFCAAIDPTLREDGYISPGLGDAGDRLFGTK